MESILGVVQYGTVQHPNCLVCPPGETGTGKTKMAQWFPWIVAKPPPFLSLSFCMATDPSVLCPWALASRQLCPLCNTPTQSLVKYVGVAYMQCSLGIVWTAEVRRRSFWLKCIICNVLCYGRQVIHLQKLQILLLPSLSIELNSVVLLMEEWCWCLGWRVLKGTGGLGLWKWRSEILLLDVTYLNVCTKNNTNDGYSIAKKTPNVWAVVLPRLIILHP